MSREIKFRVWDSSRKCFCRSFNYEGCLLDGIAWSLDVDCFNIQQFTGLKDLTGKEIYEGDILRLLDSDKLGEIKWQTSWGAFSFVSKNETYQCIALNNSNNWQLQDSLKGEIVGNIFENSELLS